MNPLQQLASLARVAASSLGIAAQGGAVLAPPSTVRDRLTRCRACPELQTGPSGARCRACGCMVERKAQVSAAACPLSRWP